MTENLVRFNMSFDEFAWLSTKFQMPPLFGMSQTIYDENMAEAVKNAHLRSGLSGLIAHGYIGVREDEKVQTLGVATGLVATIGLTYQIVNIRSSNTQGDLVTSYYVSPGLYLEHLLIPGVPMHSFAMSNTVEDLLNLMIFRLRIPVNADNGAVTTVADVEYLLDTDALASVTNQLQAEDVDPDAAIADLQPLGVEAEHAATIIDMMNMGTSHFLLWLTRPTQPANAEATSAENDETPQPDARGTMVVYTHDTQTTVALIPQEDNQTRIIIGGPERLMEQFRAQLDIRS